MTQRNYKVHGSLTLIYFLVHIDHETGTTAEHAKARLAGYEAHIQTMRRLHDSRRTEAGAEIRQLRRRYAEEAQELRQALDEEHAAATAAYDDVINGLKKELEQAELAKEATEQTMASRVAALEAEMRQVTVSSLDDIKGKAGKVPANEEEIQEEGKAGKVPAKKEEETEEEGKAGKVPAKETSEVDIVGHRDSETSQLDILAKDLARRTREVEEKERELEAKEEGVKKGLAAIVSKAGHVKRLGKVVCLLVKKSPVPKLCESLASMLEKLDEAAKKLEEGVGQGGQGGQEGSSLGEGSSEWSSLEDPYDC